MTNSEIYKKTLKFSLMSFLCALVGAVLLLGLPTVAILFTINASDQTQLIAAGIGLVLGIIGCVVIGRFASYTYTAGQIAMVAEGVTYGRLPDDPYAAGKAAVKGRFGTVAAYFAFMAIIKGITSAITNAVNAVTKALDGGDSTSTAGIIGNVISAFIAIVLEYLNYCSLGWVFVHKDENSFKAACDGSVVYFQNWKTLLKNAAKIIIITIISLVVIGGPFFLLFHNLFGNMTYVARAAAEIDDALSIDAGTSLLVAAGVVALIIWAGIHGALIEPYILVSVMRRYIEAGTANPPKLDVYGKLCGISKHFRKAVDKAEEQGALPNGIPTES